MHLPTVHSNNQLRNAILSRQTEPMYYLSLMFLSCSLFSASGDYLAAPNSCGMSPMTGRPTRHLLSDSSGGNDSHLYARTIILWLVLTFLFSLVLGMVYLFAWQKKPKGTVSSSVTADSPCQCCIAAEVQFQQNGTVLMFKLQTATFKYRSPAYSNGFQPIPPQYFLHSDPLGPTSRPSACRHDDCICVNTRGVPVGIIHHDVCCWIPCEWHHTTAPKYPHCWSLVPLPQPAGPVCPPVWHRSTWVISKQGRHQPCFGLVGRSSSVPDRSSSGQLCCLRSGSHRHKYCSALERHADLHRSQHPGSKGHPVIRGP